MIPADELELALQLLRGQVKSSKVAALAAAISFDTVCTRSIDAIRRHAAANFLSSCVSIPLVIRLEREHSERMGSRLFVSRQIMLVDPATSEGVLLDSDASIFLEGLHEDPEDDGPARQIAQWMSPLNLRFEAAQGSSPFRLSADEAALTRMATFYEAAEVVLSGGASTEFDVMPQRLAVTA